MATETDRVEPADSEQDEEDVYEVERIIDMRVEEVKLKLAQCCVATRLALANMAGIAVTPFSRRLTHIHQCPGTFRYATLAVIYFKYMLARCINLCHRKTRVVALIVVDC